MDHIRRTDRTQSFILVTTRFLQMKLRHRPSTTCFLVSAATPPTCGSARTGVAFAAGLVTGFGRAIRNGISYDTSNKTFIEDGASVPRDDLEVGQVVGIHAPDRFSRFQRG